MPYDLLEGQGQGDGTSEVTEIALFKVAMSISSAIYNGSWQMTSFDKLDHNI